MSRACEAASAVVGLCVYTARLSVLAARYYVSPTREHLVAFWTAK